MKPQSNVEHYLASLDDNWQDLASTALFAARLHDAGTEQEAIEVILDCLMDTFQLRPAQRDKLAAAMYLDMQK